MHLGGGILEVVYNYSSICESCYHCSNVVSSILQQYYEHEKVVP